MNNFTKFHVSIIKKNYNEAQLKFIKIWAEYINRPYKTNFILLEKPADKKAKINKRNILSIPCEFIRYINEETELVKMYNDDFVLLMAKIGIKVKVEEVK